MTTKSTKIAKLLFGKLGGPLKDSGRAVTFIFPAKEEGDRHREISFAGDDGLLLYLVKRIEKLEEKVINMKLSATKKDLVK